MGPILQLSGRSLMLVRNVGHLMTNPAILDQNGDEVPEGILDAMFTICIAMHDLNGNSHYKTLKLEAFTLLSQKCMVPRKYNLHVIYFQQ